MSSKAMFIPSNGKVAMRIGNRRVLASWDDAAELLAELQVVFHERNLDGSWELPSEEDGTENGA